MFFRKSFFCASAILLSAAFASQASESIDTQNLRGIYLGTAKADNPEQTVGRLALQFIEKNTTRKVRTDHVFHSGDRFRMEVSSNQNGWLYILLAPPGKRPQLLWPDKAGDGVINQVSANSSYTIPESPGAFVFDEETGKERLYVVIRSKPSAPLLLPDNAPKNESADSTKQPTTNQMQVKNKGASEQRVVQFSVRGVNLENSNNRGIVFDPGKNDDDVYLYFTNQDGSSETRAMLEFQLVHE